MRSDNNTVDGRRRAFELLATAGNSNDLIEFTAQTETDQIRR